MFGQRSGSRTPNERELKLMGLVAQGLKNSEIAEVLGTTRTSSKITFASSTISLGSGIESNLLSGTKREGAARKLGQLRNLR